MIEEFPLINEQETRNLGKMLAKRLLHSPSLIYLYGEMGTGKTTFAQGFIGAIAKNPGPIQSPSFAYMNTYFNHIAIYHFDLYRIEKKETIFELGLDEFINDEKAIRLIEWPDRCLSYESPDVIVNLRHENRKRVAFIEHLTHA
jgi:tRNA threonylcarbamoyladenosine biosynthesis protein TsaE